LSKDRPATMKDLEEMGESWARKLKEVEEKIGTGSSALTEAKPKESGGNANMPLYRCKDGKCAFTTDDLDAYIDHKIDHKTREKPAEEEKPEPKRHETVDEFLNCPECRPRFDKRYLKDGWKPPEKEAEKEKKESEGGGLDF